jgi:hypothetical protein
MGASSSSANRNPNRPSPASYPGQRPQSQMQRNPNWHANQSNNSSGAPAATAISRPGAYSVSRSTSRGSTQVFRVTVPPNVVPNQEFQVYGKCLECSLPWSLMSLVSVRKEGKLTKFIFDKPY